MTLITKMPLRAYIQRVRRNRDIYCDVKGLKCTSDRYFLSTLACVLTINCL